MTGIIILNWNGAADTIECLKSLYNAEGDFFTIVVDNGSTDNSIDRILHYIKEAGIKYRIKQKGDKMETQPLLHECILFKTLSNLGFAKGNNEALRFLLPYKAESYILLNNDTLVENEFLTELQRFSAEHPQYAALTPLICYEDKRNLVWNCGGKQKAGFRKYYYARKDISEIKETEHIDITFVTGCALFFHPDMLLEDGGIFTEKFFFGEEDFNFCINANKKKKKMACVLTSKIYHKVSSSTTNNDPIGKTYIYYLNRYIDIKDNYNYIFYTLWKLINFPNVVRILKRKGMKTADAVRWTFKLQKEANRKEGVSYDDFVQALKLRP